MFISNLLHCALNHSVQIAKLSRGSRHSFGNMQIVALCRIATNVAILDKNFVSPQPARPFFIEVAH